MHSNLAKNIKNFKQLMASDAKILETEHDATHHSTQSNKSQSYHTSIHESLSEHSSNNEIIENDENDSHKNQQIIVLQRQLSHSTEKLMTDCDKNTPDVDKDIDIDLGLDIGSDTESDDTKLDISRIPFENIATNYDDNEFSDMPYEQELIERLSIAITYLLHHKSPLWTNEENDDIEYEDDLLLLTPRTKQSKTKQNKSFQQKCMEYTVNDSLMGNLKTAQKKLNNLYTASYRSKWKSLHHFWKEWSENATILKQKYEENEEEKENEFIDLTLTEEENLEVIVCTFFVLFRVYNL